MKYFCTLYGIVVVVDCIWNITIKEPLSLPLGNHQVLHLWWQPFTNFPLLLYNAKNKRYKTTITQWANLQVHTKPKNNATLYTAASAYITNFPELGTFGIFEFFQ